MTLARLLSIAVLVIVTVAAPASGATVSAVSSVISHEDSREQRLTVTYTGSGVARDHVRVTLGTAGVRVRSPGLGPGPGCTGQSRGAVLCARAPRCECSQVLVLVVAAGRGDDEVRVTRGRFRRSEYVATRARIDAGAGADGITVDDGISGTVTGGPGDDRLAGALELYGGRGDDSLTGRDYVTLYGGGGRDRLRGAYTLVGDGPDRPRGRPVTPARDFIEGAGAASVADYRDRRLAVTVDLARGTGGQPGERDALRHIHKVWGGDGDDLLVGGPGDDELYGGDGRDRLLGAAGNDILIGDQTRAIDVLAGGSGDDRLAALGPGSSCGSDRDVVAAEPALQTAVALDCERIALSGTEWDVDYELDPHSGTLHGRTVTLPDVGADAVLRAGWIGDRVLGRSSAADDGVGRIRLSGRGRALLHDRGRRVNVEITVWKCCDEDESEYEVSYRIPLTLRER